MNDAMMEKHFERVTNERAQAVYRYLCDACEERQGGMTDPDQLMICDYAYAEQIKQMLQDDIAVRGLGSERSNGRQRYYQKNESVNQLRAYMDQQRKILDSLRLTPNARKAEQVKLDDDFDKF